MLRGHSLLPNRSRLLGHVCTFRSSATTLRTGSAKTGQNKRREWTDQPPTRSQRSSDHSYSASHSHSHSHSHSRGPPQHHSRPNSYSSRPQRGGDRDKQRSNMTPSQLFMMERNQSLEFMKAISERKARQARNEERTRAAGGTTTIGTPIQIKIPRAKAGDKGELFGPDSIQDRQVLPGDFVEVRKGGKPVCGIYTRDFDQSVGRFHSTSAVLGDQLMEHRTADVVFRIPGFLFTEKARRTVGAWDPEIQPDMPPAGSGKLAALFGEEASLLLGTHFVKFSSLYDEFWNHRQQKALTTLEAAQFVFGKEARMGQEKELTLQEIYATHMFLTQDKNLARFYPSAAVRWTGEFMIQPPHEVQLTDLVIGWIRQEDPRLEAFTQKAKELIQSYRNKEVSNWKDVQFTESDRVIIEFIRQVAVDGYYDTFPKPHLTYLPRLLRPLGLYDDMDPRTAFQFLNEIGIWPDWHNLELSRSTYQMPEMGGDDAVIVDRIRQLHPEFMDPESELDLSKEDGVSAAAVTRDTPTPMPKATSTTATSTEATINTMENTKSTTEWKPLVLQSPTELYRTDPCDSIRHDFGDIPVYAIDDPSASELDDAFSIEPVPITTLTPEASTWVHVHVADPTSILPPTHELAILASKRIQTLFLPERTWPMLPRDLTEGSLSLKNDGKPKNVLTFSARIRDLDGSIVEYRVRTGLVRNIVTLNYDEVDEVLSWGNVYGGKEEGERIRESRMSFPEQGSMVRAYYRETQGTLDRKDKKLVQELLAIQKVAVRHTSNRLGNGAFNFTMGRPLVELTPHPLPEVQDADWLAPRDFSKIPTPEISIRLDPSFASPSRMMVAEYMVMAGRVAAMFSKEHNLPVLYRQQPTPSEKYLPMFEDTIQSKSDRWTGMVNMVDMLPLRPHIPGALISLTPDPHWSLGIRDGYCKVTSPLRRYTDMIAHWQIKNKLLALSVKGSSSLVTVPPVFSVEEMVSKPGQIRDRERMLGMLEARSIKFWITEMLRRRMEAGKSMVFEGVLLNPTADGYNVISSLLGFQNVVKAEPEEIASGLGIGDRVMYELVMCNSQRPWISAKHISKL